MPSDSVTGFCKWWASLSPKQLPQPKATVRMEHKHQRYYLFAQEMKRRWLASRSSFDQVFSSDRETVRAVVATASSNLVAWFDGFGRPAIEGSLSELSKKDDALIVRLACEGGPFATRSLAWLETVRDAAARAVNVLEQVPPYLSLGAQAHRPELPLRRSSGVWATVEHLHNWPWRDYFTIRDSLADLKEPIERVQGVAAILFRHCEPPWLNALKRIPYTCASVHLDVAMNPWVAAHVLTLVLDAKEDGIMTREAHDWAQQLLAPFQVWYAKHGGSDELRSDHNGIQLIEPIRALNTAFVPPNPEVTWMPSSHVRNYCLFLRFLGDQIVGAAHEAAAETPISRPPSSSSTDMEHRRTRKATGVALVPIKAPSVGECVLEAVWSERGYIVSLGTKYAPNQRVVQRLPKSVRRVLEIVGAIDPDGDKPPALAKDDPSRFRAWFHAHFAVADEGDPLPRVKGSFIRAWYQPEPKRQ